MLLKLSESKNRVWQKHLFSVPGHSSLSWNLKLTQMCGIFNRYLGLFLLFMEKKIKIKKNSQQPTKTKAWDIQGKFDLIRLYCSVFLSVRLSRLSAAISFSLSKLQLFPLKKIMSHLQKHQLHFSSWYKSDLVINHLQPRVISKQFTVWIGKCNFWKKKNHVSFRRCADFYLTLVYQKYLGIFPEEIW